MTKYTSEKWHKTYLADAYAFEAIWCTRTVSRRSSFMVLLIDQMDLPLVDEVQFEESIGLNFTL